MACSVFFGGGESPWGLGKHLNRSWIKSTKGPKTENGGFDYLTPKKKGSPTNSTRYVKIVSMLLAKCFPTSSRTADFSCPCLVPKTTILGDRRIVWNKQIILQNSMHTSFGGPFKLPKQMRWFYHHGIIWNLSPEQKDPHAAPRAKPPPGRIPGNPDRKVKSCKISS